MEIRRKKGESPSTIPAARPPGFNPLFFGVLGAVVAGLVAAVRAGDEMLLKSNLVFRAVVGLILAAIVYVAVAALWLAWHRRTFKKISAVGAGAEAPDPAEISARDEEINEFMATTTKATEELNSRLGQLESRQESRE